MTTPALIRPPKVTMACLFVGLSCGILLAGLFSTLSNWGSLEVQQEIKDVLAQDPFKNAGLQVDDVLGWLRWALMGLAAVAAMGVVFAIYTARGHQASRVILTVFCGFAALAFLAGGFLGLIPAAFSIGCGIYLWTPDSRHWFAVKNGKTRLPDDNPFAPQGPAETQQPENDAWQPENSQPVAPPRTIPPEEVQSVPVSHSAQAVRTLENHAPRQNKCPKTVLVAGIMTIAMSALVALVCATSALAYSIDRSGYVSLLGNEPMMQDALKKIDMSPADFAQRLFVAALVATVFSLLAVLAGSFVLARKPVARIALTVLSVLTAGVSVAAFPVGLPWSAAAIAVVVLVNRSEAREWFTGRDRTLERSGVS